MDSNRNRPLKMISSKVFFLRFGIFRKESRGRKNNDIVPGYNREKKIGIRRIGEVVIE